MPEPDGENPMRPITFASAVLLAVAAGPALADETIDGPEFHSWSKFKPGTSIGDSPLNGKRDEHRKGKRHGSTTLRAALMLSQGDKDADGGQVCAHSPTS
jgi:hypothetical protein